MLRYLNSTVCYPVMNLALNLAEDAENLRTKAFLKFEQFAAKQRTLAVLRGKPFLPVFADHHRIQPPKAEAQVQADAV